MYISNLSICGYKLFDDEFTVTFNKGINVLVGENGSGKSTIVDALRLILLEDEYGRAGISESDFHKDFKVASKRAPFIKIGCKFKDLSDLDQVAYLPWLDLNDPKRASVNLLIENKEDSKGRYKRKMWGGESSRGIFEWELLEAMNCIYLPPLRDAEEKLRAYKGSRLARLFKNLNKDELLKEEPHELEKTFTEFAKGLQENKDGTIYKTNELIRDNLIKAIGTVFGQDTLIQFAETNFTGIVESLRLLYFPSFRRNNGKDIYKLFRELNENSLGYNNLIYLATILAEFEGIKQNSQSLFKILLIEEPEAHLHPQLQTRLLQYLQSLAEEENIQIIISSHSPIIASSVSLKKIIILTIQKSDKNPTPTRLSKCGLTPHSRFFLERWLDITKSTLLFAKGIILVEGIAEALIVPELAKIVIKDLNKQKSKKGMLIDELPKTIEDYGVSVINMNGIFFEHFIQLFKGYVISDNKEPKRKDYIPIRCSGITDCDPDEGEKPTFERKAKCNNTAVKLVEELKKNSDTCRLYSNLKTFEYDLAMEGNNLSTLASVLESLIPTNGPNKRRATNLKNRNWENRRTADEKADEAYWLLQQIENYADIGKGRFAQKLAYKLNKDQREINFTVPKYIADAILWSISEK